MKTRKWIVVLMVVCFMTMFAGCQESQAVTPAQIKDYAQQAENYSLMVDASQAIAKQMADTLKATGAIDANLIAKAEKIQKEIDRVQPQIIAIAEKIKSLDYSDTAQNDNITAILETLQAANTATSGINPYSGIIGVFLMLATMISTFFAKKKASEAKQANEVLDEVDAALRQTVQGIELTKQSVDLTELKANLASTQDSTTKGIIAGMK